MHIAIVAAEASGDQLGADLMRRLQARFAGLRFSGIGGAAMQARGLRSAYPMEKLGHIGLWEVLLHLPALWRLREKLKKQWLLDPPDLFIGIDAPDFNLHLECFFKQRGIPTLHYISPTVWAWRPERLSIMRRCMDQVLCIFPFEPDFLQAHGITGHYIGHPLAAQYPLHPDQTAAKQELGLSGQTVLALLPGSRSSEIKRLAPIFAQAVKLLNIPNLKIITPLAQAADRDLFLQQVDGLEVQIEIAATQKVLTAADIGLIASGTATLEALLCRTPMVVGYRLHPLSYAWLQKKVKIKQVAMANLLSKHPWAPEFIQDRCQPQALAQALTALWQDQQRIKQIQADYQRVHQSLLVAEQAWQPLYDWLSEHLK